jgi:hypothetical protein
MRAHSSLALTINLLALLTSKPFEVGLPVETYYFYFLVSIYSTYRYFYNFRTYEILDFEDLYLQLTGCF